MITRKHTIKVHHDQMLELYEQIGILDNVMTLLSSPMTKWKTRLVIWKDGVKSISGWNDIMCGFLQGDSYSPMGFCISEISKNTVGTTRKRRYEAYYNLFVDDLKVYLKSHKTLKDVNQTIVQAINDTEACYEQLNVLKSSLRKGRG